MIRDKRGLSTIVVTLIIILLSLVAVGIVWVVVRNIIVGGTAGAQVSSECINVNVDASQIACWPGATDEMCNLTLSRTGTSSDTIGGVYLVFRNSTVPVSSGLISVPGNMQVLVDNRIAQDIGLTKGTKPDSVDVSVYFIDTSGNKQICSEVSTETIN